MNVFVCCQKCKKLHHLIPRKKLLIRLSCLWQVHRSYLIGVTGRRRQRSVFGWKSWMGWITQMSSGSQFLDFWISLGRGKGTGLRKFGSLGTQRLGTCLVVEKAWARNCFYLSINKRFVTEFSQMKRMSYELSERPFLKQYKIQNLM